MNTKDLIKYFGSREQAQEKLGVSRQLFNLWFADGIPRGRQAEIQIATDGALKASLPKITKIRKRKKP